MTCARCHCHHGLGRLLRQAGRHADALGDLRTAAAYRAMGMRPALDRAEAEIAGTG